jgi:hypothetical protein
VEVEEHGGLTGVLLGLTHGGGRHGRTAGDGGTAAADGAFTYFGADPPTMPTIPELFAGVAGRDPVMQGLVGGLVIAAMNTGGALQVFV